MPFDIKCDRCGRVVEHMKYYVDLDCLVDKSYQFCINVKMLSISADNNEHDFCRTCRIMILNKMIKEIEV